MGVSRKVRGSPVNVHADGVWPVFVGPVFGAKKNGRGVVVVVCVVDVCVVVVTVEVVVIGLAIVVVVVVVWGVHVLSRVSEGARVWYSPELHVVCCVQPSRTSSLFWNVPAAQAVQVPSLVASAPSRNFPALQVVCVCALQASRTSSLLWNVPSAQALQVPSFVASAPSRNFPALHVDCAVHSSRTSSSGYIPGFKHRGLVFKHRGRKCARTGTTPPNIRLRRARADRVFLPDPAIVCPP